MGKKRINWTEIEKEFLSNPLTSLKDVAETFGVGYSGVRRMAMWQGWYLKKKRVREDVEKAVSDEVTRTVVEEIRQDARKLGSARTGRQKTDSGSATNRTQ